MLPLTSSLYVPGEVADVEKVLVDVGTGYYVEVRAAAWGTASGAEAGGGASGVQQLKAGYDRMPSALDVSSCGGGCREGTKLGSGYADTAQDGWRVRMT